MDECRMTDPQILGQWPHGQFTDAVRRDVRGYLLEQFGTAMLVTQFPAVDRRAVLHLQEPTQYRKHSSTGNTAEPETRQNRLHGDVVAIRSTDRHSGDDNSDHHADESVRDASHCRFGPDRSTETDEEQCHRGDGQ